MRDGGLPRMRAVGRRRIAVRQAALLAVVVSPPGSRAARAVCDPPAGNNVTADATMGNRRIMLLNSSPFELSWREIKRLKLKATGYSNLNGENGKLLLRACRSRISYCRTD